MIEQTSQPEPIGRTRVLVADQLAQIVDRLMPHSSIGYAIPGSPVTRVQQWLEAHQSFGQFDIVDLSEEDAFRKLLGVTALGRGALLVIKHTGFFRLLELLSAASNHDLRAPFVIIVGDEPGASSQTANDSRSLCDAILCPVFEPSAETLAPCFAFALDTSRQTRNVVVLRVTDLLMNAQMSGGDLPGRAVGDPRPPEWSGRDYYASEGLVRRRYSRAVRIANEAVGRLERNDKLNRHHLRGGKRLIVGVGAAVDRALEMVDGRQIPPVDVLGIDTPSFIPDDRLVSVLNRYRSVLILEHWEPHVELKVRCALQRARLSVEVLGRMASSGAEPFVPRWLGSPLDAAIIAFATEKSQLGPVPLVDHPYMTATDSSLRTVFALYVAAAKRRDAVPCLSVSTGRTRYSVMNSELESAVVFMPPMGSEALPLLGYLEHCAAAGSLAPGIVVGDYTFAHSAWTALAHLPFPDHESHKVVCVILENGGSRTTGGQGCTPPAVVGERRVARWRERLLAEVSVQQPDLPRLFDQLLDPSVAQDTIVIHLVAEPHGQS
jgi:TPP-dependent indolepyruvate ferredoxin oxidoreductase alpha subunit